MNKVLIILLPLCLLAACASVTPNYDAKFGDAVRIARKTQTLNPTAPSQADPALGLDAQAAVHALGRYEESFKTPPRTFEVINIGGARSGN
jgi:hypothetical protein